MSFLLASLAVVSLLAFVVYAMDEPPPAFIDLSALDDGELLPAVIDARDRAEAEVSRIKDLLDDAMKQVRAAKRQVSDLEGAQAEAVAAALPMRTLQAEVSTLVTLKEAKPDEPTDEEGGGGSTPLPSPR